MDIADVLQSEMIDYIVSEFGNKLMITVSNKVIEGVNDILVGSYIIPVRSIETELRNIGKSSECLVPGCSRIGDQCVYKRVNNELGYEPFVIERDYCGLRDNHLEISEEFRLLFNLYFDKNSNGLINLETDDKVVIFENNKVRVNLKYLRTYLALKKMALCVFFDNRVDFNDASLYEVLISSTEINRGIKIGENYSYSLCISDYGVVIDEKRYFSHLMAKKIILPLDSLQQCGVWPYEKNKEFIEFKIGSDSSGRDICFSCDPDRLSNNFSLNENAPHYLTPVFFKRSVLDKYYNDDRYLVEDGIVRCGNIWALYIDNQDREYISAYLGDLGRDLPSKEEQCHWFSYNIVCDGKISNVKFKRDMLAQATEPTSIVFKFQNKYKEIVDKTNNEIGWSIFLELNKDDEYNLTSLRIPSSYSVNEFDFLVLSLTKVIIDSINEAKLKALINQLPQKNGGINLLETFFKEKKVAGYEKHIGFLRNLQELRSSSVGHRKGSNYEKIASKFNINKNYNIVFENILNSSYEFLLFLENNIEVLK